MSQTFSLICHQTKRRMWIGQGWGEMTTLYVGDKEAVARLRRFLNLHRNKALEFVCNDTLSDDSPVVGYEEFEEED